MRGLVPQVRDHLEREFAERRVTRFEPGTPEEVVWRSMTVLSALEGEGPLGDPTGLPFEPTALSIRRWSDVDLTIVRRLPGLTAITLWDCTGVDLAQIGDAPALEKVELYRSDVTTLAPLAERPMERLAVWACPLEPHWYEWLRARWAAGVRGEKPYGFAESTWRLGRKLYDRGLVELVVFASEQGEDRISLAGREADEAGFAQLPEAEVDEILARHPDATSREMLQHLRARFHELVPQIRLSPSGG